MFQALTQFVKTVLPAAVHPENAATIDLSKEELNRGLLTNVQRQEYANQLNEDFSKLSFNFLQATQAQAA